MTAFTDITILDNEQLYVFESAKQEELQSSYLIVFILEVYLHIPG